jgi:outer membrane protein
MLSLRALRAAALAITLGLVPTVAHAESLREALASAYRNNPNILTALLSVKSTAENIALAKSGKLPSLAMSGSLGVGSTLSQQDGDWTNSASQSLGLNYSQTLFDNYKTDAEIEQARAGTEVAKYALRNAEANVLLSVAQSYYQVIRDTQLVQLRSDNMAFFDAQVTSANDRLRLGEGTKIEVSQAKARQAQAIASYRSAVASLQASQASYERWVGHKPSGLSGEFKFNGLVPASIDAAIESANARHPALLSARAGIRAAQAGSDAAAASFGPTLGLVAGIEASNSWDEARGRTGSISTSARLSLSIPIYAGGALGASMRKANIEQIKSEVDELAARDEIREAVISSWSTLQNATSMIESAQSTVESTRLVVEGTVQERDVGQKTTLDVLDAQAELISAQETLIQARATRMIATFALISAAGRLSAEDLRLDVKVHSADGYIASVEDVWAELRALDE